MALFIPSSASTQLFRGGTELSKRTEKEICDLLETVIGHELVQHSLDAGLVYEIEYKQAKGIRIEIIFSTHDSPAGDVILKNIGAIISRNFPDTKLTMELVWQPGP